MTKSNSPLILSAAINLANAAHTGQLDKQGQPYILHPLRVMTMVHQSATTGSNTFEKSGIARHQLLDDGAMVVAVLHDVVEDTPITLENLREHGFSPKIVAAVDAISKREGEGYFDEYIPRVKENPIARFVKVRDIWDNSALWRVTVETLSLLNRYIKALEILEH